MLIRRNAPFWVKVTNSLSGKILPILCFSSDKMTSVLGNLYFSIRFPLRRRGHIECQYRFTGHVKHIQQPYAFDRHILGSRFFIIEPPGIHR
jgi:hypothetical protein